MTPLAEVLLSFLIFSTVGVLVAVVVGVWASWEMHRWTERITTMNEHPWSRCPVSEIITILRKRGWRIWPTSERTEDGNAICFQMTGLNTDALTPDEYRIIHARRVDIRAALNTEYEPDSKVWLCPVCPVDNQAPTVFLPASRSCSGCGFSKGAAWHYLLGGQGVSVKRIRARRAEELRRIETDRQEWQEQERREQATDSEYNF